MPTTYILWDISRIQGPLGSETLRFSNLPYVNKSGLNVGESYRSSWIEQSYRSFGIEQKGHEISAEGVVSVGGVVHNAPSPVEVANEIPYFGAEARELDYLFTADYDFSRTLVVGSMAESFDGTQPELSEFVDFFTGTMARRPQRTLRTVTWIFQPTLGDLSGPLLTKRFNGMGPWARSPTLPIRNTDPPLIVGGSWTLQSFAVSSPGTPIAGFNTIVKIENASNEAIINLYIDSLDESLKLGLRHTGGTDVYDLFDYSTVAEEFNWIVISFDATLGTDGEFTAWVNDVAVAEDVVALNAIDGTEDEIIVSSLESGASLDMSAIRVYSTALDSEDAVRTQGPLDLGDEDDLGLVVSWEIDEARGRTITDHSGFSRHLYAPSDLLWNVQPDHGEKFIEGQVIPLAVGTCFGIPINASNPKSRVYVASVAGHSITRLYSQAISLVSKSQDSVGNFNFNHETEIISSTDIRVFGNRLVRGQEIEVLIPVAYAGVYVVESLTPSPLGAVRRQGDDYRFDIKVESPGWIATSTELATVRTIIDQADWEDLTPTSPYYPNPIPFVGLSALTFLESFPSPVTADVIGDSFIYATSPPADFVPPDDLTNVLLQLMKTYGPKFNDSTLPPRPYGEIPCRVGYYINDTSSTNLVVDEISRGCLTWVQEDGSGVITFKEFQFPEDIAGIEEGVSYLSVIHDSVTNLRRSSQGALSIQELAALNVNYAKAWSPLDEKDIPQVAPDDYRNFLSRDWRSLRVGDVDKITTSTPTVFTYENRKRSATRLGNSFLRLSQGEIFEFTLRMDPKVQLTTHLMGTKLPALTGAGGSRVVIGRRMNFGTSLLQLAVWFEQSSSDIATPIAALVATLQAETPAEDEFFGVSCAVSGSTIVAGAPGIDDGAVDFFQRSDGPPVTWPHAARVVPQTSGPDTFGHCVDIEGDTAALGDPEADPAAGGNAGRGWIHLRDQGGSGAWEEHIELFPSGLSASDRFYYACSLHGDTVAVGAYRADELGSDDGALYVFGKDVGGVDNWGEIARLVGSDPIPQGDRLGTSVSLVGTTIATGAPQDDPAGPIDDSGLVEIFEDSGGGSWASVKRLFASDQADERQFGFSCSLDRIGGDTLAVGELSLSGEPGHAYVFERDNPTPGDWGEVQLLQVSGPDRSPAANDEFGSSVLVYGDLLFVGATSTPISTPGFVEVFTRNGGSWSYVLTIEDPDPSVDGQFGRDLAISGTTLIISDPLSSKPGPDNSGRIYVYELLNF